MIAGRAGPGDSALIAAGLVAAEDDFSRSAVLVLVLVLAFRGCLVRVRYAIADGPGERSDSMWS